MANNAPAVPEILDPTIIAKITISGSNPTADFMTCGTTKYCSSCWMKMYKATIATACNGDCVKATMTAGMVATTGPINGTISRRPAIIAREAAKRILRIEKIC